MRWRDVGDLTCSVARSLAVVGDRWTLLVLRDAFLGARRFEDFRAVGLTRHRLADRLKRLVAAGVLDRVPYQDRPPRSEYRLTEKGRDLWPVIVSLTRWGDRWMADEDGPPVELIHRECGHTVMPQLACPHCARPLTARDMRALPGPGLRAKGLVLGKTPTPKEAP
jgi:DNA-binding HxlR family transcriptional regulator